MRSSLRSAAPATGEPVSLDALLAIHTAVDAAVEEQESALDLRRAAQLRATAALLATAAAVVTAGALGLFGVSAEVGARGATTLFAVSGLLGGWVGEALLAIREPDRSQQLAQPPHRRDRRGRGPRARGDPDGRLRPPLCREHRAGPRSDLRSGMVRALPAPPREPPGSLSAPSPAQCARARPPGSWVSASATPSAIEGSPEAVAVALSTPLARGRVTAMSGGLGARARGELRQGIRPAPPRAHSAPSRPRSTSTWGVSEAG